MIASRSACRREHPGALVNAFDDLRVVGVRDSAASRAFQFTVCRGQIFSRFRQPRGQFAAACASAGCVPGALARAVRDSVASRNWRESRLTIWSLTILCRCLRGIGQLRAIPRFGFLGFRRRFAVPRAGGCWRRGSVGAGGGWATAAAVAAIAIAAADMSSSISVSGMKFENRHVIRLSRSREKAGPTSNMSTSSR